MNFGPGRAPDPLRRTIDSLTGELLTVYEELALLYSMAAQFGRLNTAEQVAEAALREAIGVLHGDCGWVALWQGDKSAVPEECCIGIQRGIAESIDAAVLSPGRSAHVLCHDLGREYGLPLPGAPLRFLAGSLSTGNGSQGYLCVARREGGIFTSADQKLLSSVASLTAITMENLRLRESEMQRQRLEAELELARRIQSALLPRDFSPVDFLEASGVSLPCYEVGGDYFDLLPLHQDSCLVAIADVSGKGPAAALQAAMVQGIVHALCRQSVDLPTLMETLNACLLARAIQGKFVTAFLASVDRWGRVRYANGGHNPGLWIRGNGSVELLREGGPLLGLLEHSRYTEATIQMSPGDLLLLYTDGVTDSEDGNGQPFGDERLLGWASRQYGGSAAQSREDLLAVVGNFCGGRPQEDDLTFLVVQYSSAQ